MTQPNWGFGLCIFLALHINLVIAANASATFEIEVNQNDSGLNKTNESTNSSGETCNLVKILETFLVDFPCFLLCLTLTILHFLIWNTAKLQGWIVVALTTSFSLRCAIHTTHHILHCFTEHEFLSSDFPALCVAVGKEAGKL